MNENFAFELPLHLKLRLSTWTESPFVYPNWEQLLTTVLHEADPNQNGALENRQ